MGMRELVKLVLLACLAATGCAQPGDMPVFDDPNVDPNGMADDPIPDPPSDDPGDNGNDDSQPGDDFELLSAAGFEAPQTPSFVDVAPNDIFYVHVEWMKAAGLSKGYTSDACGESDGPCFLPSRSNSRAAFAEYLYRAVGSPKSDTPAGDYPADVSGPFVDAIEWGYDEGIFTAPRFEPAAEATREDAALWLYRYADRLGLTYDASHSFKDVDPSGELADSVGWMATEGVTNGYGDNTYRPDAGLTRQSLAVLLFRMSERDYL